MLSRCAKSNPSRVSESGSEQGGSSLQQWGAGLAEPHISLPGTQETTLSLLPARTRSAPRCAGRDKRSLGILASLPSPDLQRISVRPCNPWCRRQHRLLHSAGGARVAVVENNSAGAVSLHISAAGGKRQKQRADGTRNLPKFCPCRFYWTALHGSYAPVQPAQTRRSSDLGPENGVCRCSDYDACVLVPRLAYIATGLIEDGYRRRRVRSLVFNSQPNSAKYSANSVRIPPRNWAEHLRGVNRIPLPCWF